jgi:hypothetical protein
MTAHPFIRVRRRVGHPGITPRITPSIGAPTGHQFVSEGQRPGITAPNQLKSPERAKPFSETRQIQGAAAFTAVTGICQGILDGSIRRQLHDNRRAVETQEVDRDDVKELAAAEKKLLQKPEDKEK